MTTTGRSESTKAYFDGHVHSNTMLNEFVVQYDKVVRALREAKKKERLPKHEHAGHLK